MALVTEQTIMSCYELLITCPPFNRWNLPPSGKMTFEVIRDPQCYGEYEPEPHTIRVSTKKNGHLYTMITTVAHEICHLRLEQMGVKKYETHGKSFKKLTDRVSKSLGFDPLEL